MNQPITPSQTQANVQTLITVERIQAWLVEHIAEQLGVEPTIIDISVPFENYGLDSGQAAVIISQAEQFLGFQPPIVLLWHYNTIESFAERLAEEFADSEEEIFEI